MVIRKSRTPTKTRKQLNKYTMENKLNSGAIFKNDKKTKDTHPDYRGKVNVNGKEMEIALWVKQGKNGSFMSASFSEPYVAPVSAPISQVDNDDFPF